ncbi:MAG: cell division protein ZapA [Clostridia bacterium]|nr:cell division protein ZapA [Clostridia bacterium]
MDKQKLTLSIGGRSYTIVSADPPEYLRRVADYADRKLREVRMASRLPSGQADVLALVSLADELLKAQDENRRLRRQLREMGAAAASDADSGEELPS